MRNFFIVCFLGIFSTLHSQETYKVSDINLKMLLNANAVVREHHIEIEIKDIDDVEISTTRVITVLNEAGETFINAYENYDDGHPILDQEAIIFNSKGEEIKKFKKRDFTSKSNFQNFVLFSDNRVSHMNYTPRDYPYTVKYTSRVRTINSIFLPDWWPVEGYKVSVENSSYRILNETEVPIRFSERNLDGLEVVSENSEFDLNYSAKNIMARSHEQFSPHFRESAPRVLVALDRYHLEGISGESNNWQDFGKWQYENLVNGQGELTEEVVSRVSELTKDAASVEDKARIIYRYVQENTRYIAVMLGIGGWKPYTAQEVDRLGYGDCKGLTNYTRALLASQGIDSDYTVIYGGNKRDIDPDFTKMQGNHVILSVPRDGEEDIWLECTSQDAPFNYLGDFTDDRFALKIKPEGGEIVRTKKYSAEDNLRTTAANITITETGGFQADLERKSYGVPYGDIYPLELQTENVKKNFYRENWPRFHNVEIDSIQLKNDKEKIEFTEKVVFKADRLCSKAGERLLIPLNFIDALDFSLEEDKKRVNNIKIYRGKSFRDTFKYELPEGFMVEALPKGNEITTEFGHMLFNVNVEEGEEGKVIVVERFLKIEEGNWSPDKFENYRNFITQIHNLSNQKAVIVPENKA
ncbi:DUF3857 domain-containing transglutaminase family protein [Gramella lutea]|uniref:DUF3857 domain-containing transglutaminase family protein n=1 Tax=Christiangramia lutea TaxID=1607951 RepID=A0A9X1V020_9FLAO|nr:DUF3857 domain-containing protein [Christiangramia lutea]MCH4821797.1 DUF3857 domain-containing transglutaminase family protein [Christiangramia lutea]